MHCLAGIVAAEPVFQVVGQAGEKRPMSDSLYKI